MHPEQIRVGMWIRIEDIAPCKMPPGDGAVFVYSQQLNDAQYLLSRYGGIPLQVVAAQFPFVLVNAGPRGLLMLDLRFNRVGKCDERFVTAIKRIRQRSAQIISSLAELEKKDDGDGSVEVAEV